MPLARSSGGPSIEKQHSHTMLIRRNADSQGDSRLCSGNRARPARCGSGSPSRNRPASGRARPASIQPKCAERPLDSTVYSAFAAHIQPKPAPSSRDRRHAAESTRGGGGIGARIAGSEPSNSRPPLAGEATVRWGVGSFGVFVFSLAPPVGIAGCLSTSWWPAATCPREPRVPPRREPPWLPGNHRARRGGTRGSRRPFDTIGGCRASEAHPARLAGTSVVHGVPRASTAFT